MTLFGGFLRLTGEKGWLKFTRFDEEQMNERTFNAGHAHRLEDPERLTWLPPDEVIGQISIKPGAVVADIGAGTGYFTLPIARAVGDAGRVYAVDFQREMLSHIRKKLSAPGSPSNVQVVEGEAARTTLPAGSCDVVFMANLWHELDDYPDVLREVGRILRAGGFLAIVDWRADLPSPPGPPVEHRVAASRVQATLRDNGWSVLKGGQVGIYSHLILAEVKSVT